MSTKGLTKDLINKFSILNGTKYFSERIYQLKNFKYFSFTTRIDSWKSNGMLKENTENITKSASHFAPIFVDHHLLPDINFNGHFLIKK